MTGLVASLTMALVLSPGQADGITLRWKLKEGDTFYAKAVMNMEQTVVAMGNNIDQKQDTTTVYRYKVAKADKDGYKIEQTILQAITETNIPGANLGDLNKKMQGAVFTITMNDKFKVTKMEGITELVKKLGEDNPMLKTVLAGIMNEEVMKKGVEDVFTAGPEKAVKIGDTWTKDEKFPLGPLGEMAMKMNYKLEKSKDGTEEISFSGDAKYSPPKEGAEGLPFTISKADLKTDKFTGTTFFDSKTGRTKETKADMTMSGSMTVKVGEIEVSMDLKQKLTTKTEILEKNPVVD